MTSVSRPPTLKERQRQEREALILRAAADLLAERGYHEMSLDDIAARVGISKGAIYLHFARKEDLVIALLEQGSTVFLRELETVLSSDDSPPDKLRAIIRQYSVDRSEHRHLLLGAIFQNPEIQTRMAEWRCTMHRRWEEPRRRITEVVEQGKMSGDFDSTLPTPLLVSLLMSFLNPYGFRRLMTEEGMTREEVTQGLSKFFMKGISHDATASAARDDF